jgi:homoserine O-acetyltransferase
MSTASTRPAADNPRAPRRLSVRHTELDLNGHPLRDVELAGWAYGPELGKAPIFVVVGGISASPFPFGDGVPVDEGGQGEGWWSALGDVDLIDPVRHSVLCPAWPGNGSTWAGFDDEATTPPNVSVQDLADLVALWLAGIGCNQPVIFIGASLGGMVGVAFAVRHPKRVYRLVTISAGLRPDGWGTATRHLQRELVRDGQRNGDVKTGMARARQLGMLTYRSRYELDTRFGRLTPDQERPPVASYLDHHGKRFAEQFPVRTFLLLSGAIDRCSLGDSPQQVRAELAKVEAEVVVVGVPGDLLFPWSLQNEIHRELQAIGGHSSLWKLDSPYGHDAFLADQERLADLMRLSRALHTPATPPSSRPRFQGVGTQPLREIRIGMIGCGTVGQGLLELLAAEEQALADRYGVRFTVTKIAVRDVDKNRGPHAEGIPRITDAMALVPDPEVDAIVEVAGGIEPFDRVLSAALAAGIPVVTANKVLLAQKLAELGVLAQRTKTPLACEASAAAALPILRHLNHRADEVERLMAIVNGTCNYVITRLEQDELAFDIAIAEAQKLGLAEADPTMDVDGFDAAAKLSILTYRSFGAWFRPDTFAVRGIRELTPADCDLAEAMGHRIRHIARAARVGDALDLAVEPLLLPEWHLLANVEEEYNAVYLNCRMAGDLSFFGKGAGALPTATAVLGDLIDLAQDNSARWPEPRPVSQVNTAMQARRRYLRVTATGAHPGLSRRVDSHLRRAGLRVTSQAERQEGERVHLGRLVSACSDAEIGEVQSTLEHLGRVAETLTLGVDE